ncbi:MAG: CPBP family intramembrane glutamic endopeptidase [Promethearchaeota archaeon]
MSYDESLTKDRINNSIIYNSLISLIFLFWFFYTTSDNISILLSICLVIFLVVLIKFFKDRRHGFEAKQKIFYVLLFIIPFSLYGNIIFLTRTSAPTYLIPFNSLVGMKHNHNLILALAYFSIIMLKLIGVKFYFTKNEKILKEGRGDDLFKYFTKDITSKKILLLVILFPLVAFIEELIYRSFFLSLLTYYLKWDIIISIVVISIIFGLVHYSTSKNWGHVISTFISSIIYSFALIQLGILYPWLFHLGTNLAVLLFYYQAFKKNFEE